MSRKPLHFDTVADAIKALDGTGAVARSLGVTVERVCNWVSRGWFPNDVLVFVGIRRLLKSAGMPEGAADHLFRPLKAKEKRRRPRSNATSEDRVA